MRGKAALFPVGFPIAGITPAYAGKSVHVLGNRAWFWDHPRVCGEKLVVPLVLPLLTGSPPRMRGKVDVYGVMFFPPWITPAYAGKRALGPNGRAAVGDHPRVCGEKTKKIP